MLRALQNAHVFVSLFGTDNIYIPIHATQHEPTVTEISPSLFHTNTQHDSQSSKRSLSLPSNGKQSKLPS